MDKELKKIRVYVLVNTLTSVNSFNYHNHIVFFVWHAKNHPEIEFVFDSPHRTSIDNARNAAAVNAMAYECDYLLFLDDDVMIPSDSLWRLIQANRDICAGLVMLRGYPFHTMAFKWTARTKKQRNLGFMDDLPKKPGLVKCDAVGFSLALIKVEMLKKLSAPFFITGKGNTEDVYFCIKASEELGKKVSIYMDTRIECGHLLNPEPIAWSNQKQLRRYYESVMPKEKKEDGERGLKYIRRNISLLGK